MILKEWPQVQSTYYDWSSQDAWWGKKSRWRVDIQKAKLGRLLDCVSWGNIVGDMLRSIFLWANRAIWELSLAAGAHLRVAEVATARGAPMWNSSQSCITQPEPRRDCEGYGQGIATLGLVSFVPQVWGVEQKMKHFCPTAPPDLYRSNTEHRAHAAASSSPKDACTSHPCRAWVLPFSCPQVPQNKQKCFAIPSMQGKGPQEKFWMQERSMAHDKMSRRCLQGAPFSPLQHHHPATSECCQNLPPSSVWMWVSPRDHCSAIPWRTKSTRGQTPKVHRERKIQTYCTGPEREAGEHQQNRDPGAPAMVINEHWYYQCTAGLRLFVNAGMTQPVPQHRLCSWYSLCIGDKSLENESTDLTTKAKFNADSDARPESIQRKFCHLMDAKK